MNTVKIHSLILVLVLLSPTKGFTFFGALALLGPAIASSIMNAKTADNTKKLLTEVKNTNLQLRKIVTAMQNGIGPEDVKKLFNSIYGTNKISGGVWNYDAGGTTYSVTELNLSTATRNFLTHFKAATDPIGIYNHSNILFHEELGTGSGEMDVTDLEALGLNNIDFETDVLKYLTKVKGQLLDPLDDTSRYKDYIEKIDDTITLKSSVDLGNLLALENLVQNKFALEVQVYGELIDTYEILKTSATRENVEDALGTLHTFTITP